MLSAYVFSNLIYNYGTLGNVLLMLIFLVVLGFAGEIFFMRRGRQWPLLAVPAALVALGEVVYLFYKGYTIILVLGLMHYVWALLIGAALGWLAGKTLLRRK